MISVIAMAVAIPVGAAIITNVFSKPTVVLPWVVFVVGAHFLPFARAFQLPVFRWLAVSLIAVAVIGAAVTLASESRTAAGWTGVAAGFALLVFSAIGNLRVAVAGEVRAPAEQVRHPPSTTC
ncbi:hypothetical protein [Nocardioides alcanivorans]|uniref:hypothetical protein n=1 Tax=Nocardioides alcanivorans TaxID=2897352 RepID=UPI001F430FC6|nr:hypothetical protein [Nocardioides alcanivorans]